MCCHRSYELAAERPGADRCKVIRIHLERCMTFFQREQFAGMPDDVRVRDAVGFDACTLGSDSIGLNAANSALPAACSVFHLTVLAQRLRYETRPPSTMNACTIPSPPNQ